MDGIAPIIIAVIGALGAGGIGAAAVTAWANRGKTNADASAILAESQRQFSDDLREVVSNLQTRLDAAELRIAQLEEDKLALQGELLALRSDAAQADGRIAALTDERDRWRNEAGRLARVEAEQQARIVELETRVHELEARLARVENGRDRG